MTDSEILEQLQDMIPKLGIELWKADGDFAGGLCCIRGRKVFLINSALPIRRMVEIMCRELAHQDLTKIFIRPAIRKRIESYH
jgi:hypothetical protein